MFCFIAEFWHTSTVTRITQTVLPDTFYISDSVLLHFWWKWTKHFTHKYFFYGGDDQVISTIVAQVFWKEGWRWLVDSSFLEPPVAPPRFRWAREGRICPQKFLHFSLKRSGQKRPKTARIGVGSSVGCCSMSALVPLWALNAVNPCPQSYGPLSGGFVPCKNSTQKWLHAVYTLSFPSLKLLTPRSVSS